MLLPLGRLDYGFSSAADRARLQAIVTKAARWGVWAKNGPTLDEMFCAADSSLFRKVLNDRFHVLHRILPPIKSHGHNLRRRAHNRILPLKTPSLIGDELYNPYALSLISFKFE